jgi:hypothetical protein
MNIKAIVTAAVQEYIAELKSRKNTLPAVSKLTIQVNRSTNSALTSLDYLNDYNKLENVVYVIKLLDAKMNVANVVTAYRTWKSTTGKDTHLSKLNGLGSNQNRILYVGSKRTRFGSRIKQHVGMHNKRTYALHLKEWLPELPTKIGLEYYVLGPVKPKWLQFVEDALWDTCKPLFGKRGAH